MAVVLVLAEVAVLDIGCDHSRMDSGHVDGRIDGHVDGHIDYREVDNNRGRSSRKGSCSVGSRNPRSFD